jgi:hypothetical protein
MSPFFGIPGKPFMIPWEAAVPTLETPDINDNIS